MTSDFQLDLAVKALRSGGTVLHALEGVWGLACDPFNAAAVARLLHLKGRSVGKGLIVIAATPDCFVEELERIDATARDAVLASWPGAETWIVPSARFPYWVTGGRAEVAVRVPGHEQARALAARFGGPLISSSANPAGRPPALNRWQALSRFPGARFPGRLDYILPGAVINPGRASRIRTIAGVTLRS